MNKFTIHWGASEYAPLFLLLIPISFLLVLAVWKKERIITFLTDGGRRSFLIKHYSFSKQILKSFLFAVACIVLIASLLHPQWNKKEEKVSYQGRDLLIALDISRSMLAKDMNPDRLSFAKAKIHALVNSLPSDRVGLILFAGAPCLVCPLTTDYDSFFMFLDQVDSTATSAGGTALDQVIKEGIAQFSKMADRKNKLLVIFTDGEDFSADLARMKKEALALNLKIFAFGVGSAEGAPVPAFDTQGKQTGYEKDNKGSIVISHLNGALLKKLVNETGGYYHQATKNNQDIQKMVAQLGAFDKEKIDEKKRESYQEQYMWFVLGAFICLVIEWLL